MVRSVKITTPIPSLEEFGRSLGLSKARQRALMQIMTGSENGHAKAGRFGSGMKAVTGVFETERRGSRAAKRA
jgi:hypothetical protein